MHIEVTAGNKYDKSTGFRPIAVNQGPIHLDTEYGPVDVAVQIKGFKLNGEPIHSDYFEKRSNVNFSIQFTLQPNRDIHGDQLLWGNDFDSPIRDLLPWGFSAAFATFKRLVDPSVEGDVYADKPYLYGPVLSSINYIQDKTDQPKTFDLVEEPEATARQKRYLDETKRKEYVFKKGQTYAFDFCTPYLELSTQLAVKLPGFTFDVGKYADKTELRYVLKVGDELVFRVSLDVVDDERAEGDDKSKNSQSKEADNGTSKGDPNPAAGAQDSEKSGSCAKTAGGPTSAGDIDEVD